MNTNSERKSPAKGVLIYPEISYKIVGAAFDVFNQLGFGFQEKAYQEALAIELKSKSLNFRREKYSPVSYKGLRIGSYFYDFIIEDKVVLELKVGTNFYENNLSQILSYLKSSNLKLGILVVFTPKGVISKRIIN